MGTNRSNGFVHMSRTRLQDEIQVLIQERYDVEIWTGDVDTAYRTTEPSYLPGISLRSRYIRRSGRAEHGIESRFERLLHPLSFSPFPLVTSRRISLSSVPVLRITNTFGASPLYCMELHTSHYGSNLPPKRQGSKRQE
jgi:hypothetical protein